MNTSGLTRRDLLKVAVVGGAGAATAAALGAFDRAPDAPTTEADAERSRELAEQFAPVYYFDAHERWFPTDPRPYEREADGEPVVDGFSAFDGYTERYREEGAPPDPTVFYRVVEYEDSSLAAVQYWWYASFDQFSVNFHWHDWEVVHVFVDLETEVPHLFVASAHSRNVPNNEFLDPETPARPRVLPELGSHSSGLSVNDIRDQFTRLPLEDAIADVTNNFVEGLDFEVPAAYGLPRDEGFRLPFVLPELDGEPIYEHERLPAVDREALIDADLTVRSLDDLSSPPTDLPTRETGPVFAFDEAHAEADVDVTYELVPTAELEHLTAFAGPQLSFEFAVPDVGEDLVSGHITTTAVPWEQTRYDNPAADVSDPVHRQALSDRYDAVGDPSPVNRLVAAVRETEPDEEAPDGEGVTTSETSVETVCRLESDPVAVPTSNGVAVVDDLPPGDHRLTVNGAGLAPHDERVSVTNGGGPDFAGVDGEVALPPAGEAVKLEVDTDGTDADLTALAVEDDFGGRLYDAPLDGPDAVYVHGGGAYTAEVRDAADEVGAFRVNPAGEERRRIDEPATGKASLGGFVSEVTGETRDRVGAAAGVDLDPLEEVAEDDDLLGDGDGGDTGGTDSDGSGDGSDGSGGSGGSGVGGLLRALEAVYAAAVRAIEHAENGDAPGADRRLETVSMRLENVAERLEAASEDLPDPVARAVDRRLEQARRRTDQAIEAERL